MKRILFYYDNYCGEKSHGGTEVATFRIAKALKGRGGWEIFHASKRRRGIPEEDVYSKSKILKRKTFVADLAEFLSENDIDVVVNMGRFYRHPLLQKAIRKSGRKINLLFMHHFAPGSESKKHTYAAGWHLLRLNPGDPSYWTRASLYPLFKLQRRLCLSRMYRKILEESDRVILLSDGYKGRYLQKAYGSKAGKANNEKLTAIANIYDPPTIKEAVPKEKRVLILSRMDEIQKRLSQALKIWKKIEEKEGLEDWRLDIVGSGHDMEGIKKLARRLGLKRAEFHGWQDSKPYLQHSAILMSTSDYEGLPLSMIEAQVYGCIPIAFNSYESLKDIITDGETGMVVEEFGDIEGFADKLADLMSHSDKRERMACNGTKNAEKFSSETIGFQWHSMLSQLAKNN